MINLPVSECNVNPYFETIYFFGLFLVLYAIQDKAYTILKFIFWLVVYICLILVSSYIGLQCELLAIQALGYLAWLY